VDRVQVVREYWKAVEARDWQRAWASLHPDFVATWPVTRERFSRQEFIKVNEEYPGEWHIHVDRVHALGEEVVSVVTVTAGPQWFCAVSFFEFEGLLVTKAKEYWADGVEPPDWRKGLGERG